jgi:hypothetical protein
MTQLTSIRDLQPLEQSHRAGTVNREAHWLRSVMKQRDLLLVIGFCAVGLIMTFAALMQLQGFSAAIGDISLVP